jgi:GAF domain-containing protein
VNAQLPTNEKERLRTLSFYRVLDTGTEKLLDDLTRLASVICQTPVSLISLVDEERQWFKSKVGLEASQTPRNMAFCAHTILQDEVMVVRDATQDPRFADNPLVLNDPNIRFYAGAPLTVAPGISLGSLCVIDKIPRTLTSSQLEALETLRNAVVNQLELRRALADLRDIQSMIPMCSWCRNVRDANGEWKTLESYVNQSGQVTHGLCSSCEKGLETGDEFN